MAAQCAICNGPITKTGEKFVLAGTEAFHDRCAVSRGTHTSIGNRRLQQLVELEREVAQLKREHNAISRGMEGANTVLRQQVADSQQETRNAEGNAQSWRRRYEEARGELEQQTTSAAALRTEVTRLTALARQQPAPAATTSKPADTRDDTEIRFSLLDLD